MDDRHEVQMQAPAEVDASDTFDNPALKARLLREVQTQPMPPTRRMLVRQTIVASVGSWLIGLLVFAYAGGVRMSERPTTLVVGTACGTFVVAILAAWAALGRGKSTLGRARVLLLPIVVASPLLILAWKIFWSAEYEGALSQWPTRPGFRCLSLSLSIAICPLLAFVFARKGSDPRHPITAGFAAGLAIGSITSLLTDLWCPVAYIPHLLLGHLLPIVLLGGIGAWLGRLFLTMR